MNPEYCIRQKRYDLHFNAINRVLQKNSVDFTNFITSKRYDAASSIRLTNNGKSSYIFQLN